MSKRQKRKIVQRETNKLKRHIIEKVLSKSSNVAFNLDLLVDGWLELESDPGTFSLLIEDFGCFGAQVDEVYDLEQKFDGPVFGFIFLFKWLNNQHNDRSTATNSIESQSDDDQRQWSYVEDENIISEIFFAKQMISNSCATHALISILLNCDYDELNLGPTLTRLKEHTKIMDPENKGYAIGNVPEIAKAHNSHASYSSLYARNKPNSKARGISFVIRGNHRTNLQQQQNQPETYHFVSYVPINNRLYELDGLKNYPIDHGPVGSKEDWTEKFRSVIKHRLEKKNDIRYNLMAVVPDRRLCLKAQVEKLRCYLKTVQESILSPPVNDFHENPPPYSPQSNGTLTASEAGSLCNSPENFEDSSFPMDEIPHPPFSPLSNDTLTASEAGSVYNSPKNLEDSLFFDNEGKLENYFVVKFDRQASSPPLSSKPLEDLKKLTMQIKREIEKLEILLKEENDKRRKYKIDNSRRAHNYEPFIMTFLSMLAKQGNLADLIEKDLGIISEESEATPQPPTQQQPSPLSAQQSAQLTSTNKCKPQPQPIKSRYKYVKTGRPRGRPRKNPID